MKYWVLCAALWSGVSVAAEVDPAWLRAWNEALAAKSVPLSSVSRIGSPDEPGVPFVVRGTVFTPDGEVAPNVVVHSYHRDAEGFELGRNDRELTMWRLQGWAITDERGKFEFQTIRPAADYLGREAAHIHFTLVSGNYGNQWAPKVFLADDPMLSERDIARSRALGQFALFATPEKRNNQLEISVVFTLKSGADF
ncbi:MAG: hypothetical protein AAFN07_17000 [Pseudomonadota bacterium]